MMALDANGRPQPTGQFETLTADAVVLALGQETESGFLRRRSGVLSSVPTAPWWSMPT